MQFEPQREAIVHFGKKLVTAGLTSGTGGNLSLRDPRSGAIVVTPSGVDYFAMVPEDVPVVDLQGRLLAGRLKPTSELAFHLFLDNLFKDGTLNDLTLTAERLAGYLRHCAERIAEWHQASKEKPTYAIAITNGQVMGTICSGEVVHYSHREGIHACSDHTDDESLRQSHGRFKGIMIGAQMSDPGHQWREVADGSLLTISRSLELKVEQI